MALHSDFRIRLRQNHEILARDLDARLLMDKLYAESVFTLDEMESILALPTRHEQVTQLLTQLPRKGARAFGHLLDALEEPFPDLREMLLCDVAITEDDQLQRMREILASGQVPARPEYFADRPEEVEKVRSALANLKDSDGWVVLHGMGGSGKTMLAAEALRDHELLISHFPDGIFWLTIGQIRSEDGQVDSSKLLTKMQNLITRMEHEQQERPPNIEAAHDRLVKIFAEYKRALLILDDVWSQIVARVFAVRCRCLVTSRFAGVANQTRAPHLAEIALTAGFTLDQTKQVFSHLTAIPVPELPMEAKHMHDECKGLPLAVAMLGALLKPDPKLLRWEYFLKHLQAKKISRIRSTSSESSNFDSLSASIGVSVDALAEQSVELHQFYIMFAIFDDDPVISSQVLAVLWGVSDPIDVEIKMDHVLEMSLAHKVPASRAQSRKPKLNQPTFRRSHSSTANLQHKISVTPNGATPLPTPSPTAFLNDVRNPLGRARSMSVSRFDYAHYSLHDLQLDYLKEEVVTGEKRKELHQRLIRGYAKKCEDRYHELPDDGYVHRYLAYHMLEADQGTSLCKLLTDLRWIEQKLLHCGADDLLNDYLRFLEYEKRAKLQADTDKPVGVAARRRPGRGSKPAIAKTPSRATGVEDQKVLSELKVYQRFISIQAHRLLQDPTVSIIQLALSQPKSSVVYQQAWMLAKEETVRDSAYYVRQCNAGVDVQSHQLTVRLHQEAVTSVQCCSGSLLAVSCSTDMSVRLWNRITGGMVATLEGHENYVTQCCFNPCDAVQIISSSEDNTVRVWQFDGSRMGTAEQVMECRGEGKFMCCDVAPDGDSFVAGDIPGYMKVYNIVDGRLIHNIAAHEEQIQRCVFSKDGKFIATASSDMTAKLWSTHYASLLATFTEHTGIVYGCAFSADSQRLVTCSGDTSLKVWSTQTTGGESLFTLRKGGDTLLVCTFSPDDKFILAGTVSGNVQVWDGRCYDHLYNVAAHNGWVQGLSFESDGKRFASCSDDCTCKIWALSESARRETAVYDRRLDLFVDYDTGAVTVSCLDKEKNEIVILRGEGLDVIDRHGFNSKGDAIKSFALASDLQTVAYASTEGRIQISKTSAGVRDIDAREASPEHIAAAARKEPTKAEPEAKASLRDAILCDDSTTHSGEVKIVVFSQDWPYMVAASVDGVQSVWHVKDDTAKLHFTLKKSMASHYTPFVFFKTQPWLLSLDTNGRLLVHNLEDGTEVASWSSGEGGQPLTVFVSAGDEFIAAAVGQKLNIWRAQDLAGGQSPLLVAALAGHKDVVRSSAISPDGKRVATGSDDRTIVLWDTERQYSQVKKMKIRRTLSWIIDMAFSAQSDLLVTLSDRINFWLAKDGIAIRTIHLHGAFTKYIRHDPDFTTLATVDDKGSLYLLEVVFGDEDEE